MTRDSEHRILSTGLSMGSEPTPRDFVQSNQPSNNAHNALPCWAESCISIRHETVQSSHGPGIRRKRKLLWGCSAPNPALLSHRTSPSRCSKLTEVECCPHLPVCQSCQTLTLKGCLFRGLDWVSLAWPLGSVQSSIHRVWRAAQHKALSERALRSNLTALVDQ